MTQVHTKPNADQQELDKFASMADAWWDREGLFKSLHDINPLRLNYIESRYPLPECTALDVGCGGGILAEGMAYRGACVTGIDLAQANLEVAQKHAIQSGLDIAYQNIQVELLADMRPEQFDLVTCMEMLEHVPEPASVVNACARLAKPGGHLFFSTLNRNPKAYLFAILGAEYVLNLVPRGTHDYLKFIQPAELARWARQENLIVHDVTGLTYHPLTRRYRLIRNVDVNYFMHCSKPSP